MSSGSKDWDLKMDEYNRPEGYGAKCYYYQPEPIMSDTPRTMTPFEKWWRDIGMRDGYGLSDTRREFAAAAFAAGAASVSPEERPITRFDLWCHEEGLSPEPSPHGEWVRYQDFKTFVAAPGVARREAEELRMQAECVISDLAVMSHEPGDTASDAITIIRKLMGACLPQRQEPEGK